MKLDFRRYDLRLKHTFTISRSSRDTVPVIIVRFEKDGIASYGEASPNARYGETIETVKELLEKIELERLSDPSRLEEVNEYLDSMAPGNPSAKCAIDIAMHDWICKKLRVPVYKFFDADKGKAPISSFTIGIDAPNRIIQKVKEAVNYPVLKIKVGFPGDEEIIKAVRSVTGKPLRVDANEGWKSKEEALDKINWLAAQNVQLVEQPIPAEQIEDARWLKARTSIPIIADEALAYHDLSELSTAYDGINVKLQKNGGLFKARKLIHEALERKMKVMLGCMIETSVGITAAAHLSPLVDWNDLDGNVLISNDPFKGVTNKDGRLILGNEPGLGVKPT
jgi:L-alanine-DL-glutamate epimerase-like enolase superfamily enzyme